jgi:hypothetical protein
MDLKENMGVTVSPKSSRKSRKETLQQTAEKSLEAIQSQLGDLKKVGTNALIIGGTIVAVYALMEVLLPAARTRKEEKYIEKEDETIGESILWAGVKGIATSMLLALAKDKLMELLEQITEKDAKKGAE